MTTDDLHLSPSAYHAACMDAMQPRHCFDGGDVTAWQDRLRASVRRRLGLELDQPRNPLQVRSLWSRAHALGHIEKIAFTAEPGADVLAYVCLPRHATPPYTWFICVQGHSTGMHNSIGVDRDTNETDIEVDGDRDFGLGCMRRGLAALCIEQRAFGERRERRLPRNDSIHGCHEAAMHALMLGKTLVGERVYDVERGIDYLASRDDVDMTRLGVMGDSGGGTVSLFSAATLPRLRFAMPTCYFCTFRASIMSIYHCVDNYIPGLLQDAEMADVMGLFAPRPVVIVAGREDEIFPIAATRAAFDRLQRIYAAAGAADHCHLVIGAGGHRFYANDAWPVMLDELAHANA